MEGHEVVTKKVSDAIIIDRHTIGNENVNAVDARSLHEFLESKQEYIHWIKKRINEYGFVDGKDFLIILSKTPTGGRPRTEYIVSIDMAKELSMVERNEKGKEARRYFIECEKKIHATSEISIEEKLELLCVNYLEERKKVKLLEKTTSELSVAYEESKPKVEAFDRRMLSDKCVTLSSCAKHLKCHPRKFIEELRGLSILGKRFSYVRKGKNITRRYHNEPYVDHIENGYFVQKSFVFFDYDGNEFVDLQTVVTQKGMEWLAGLVENGTIKKSLIKIKE